MIILQAPYPNFQTTSLLPNPELEDKQNLQTNFVISRSMNGTYFTYKKGARRHKLVYTWNHLAAYKAEEIKLFLKSYSASPILMTNFKDEVWVCTTVNSPFSFNTKNPYIGQGCHPRPEAVQLTLEFEGRLA